MRVLVTGGAGFIGSHLVDALLQAGHQVVVLDNMDPNIHPNSRIPYLNPDAKYVRGDVRSRADVRSALKRVEMLFHLASLIDVAESARDPGKYVEVNVHGTAIILDEGTRAKSLRRLLLASSVAVYGEGAYACTTHGPVKVPPRSRKSLENGRWDVLCPNCSQPVAAQATSEKTRAIPLSTYGWTKLTQESMFQAASRAFGIPAVILRYANVYGTRQRAGAYAGVCTVFHQLIQGGEPLTVHEDGLQTRDFVSVEDVVRATQLAMDVPLDGSLVANVGTGEPTTILGLATMMAEMWNSMSAPTILGTFREGDIRNLWVDTKVAREKLGFTPTVNLEEGLLRSF